MDQSEFVEVEVGFAPSSFDNRAYAPNEVTEVPTVNGSTTSDLNLTDHPSTSLEENGGELRRDRAFSASVMSRKSTVSNRSRASLSPSILTSDYCVNKFCSYQEGSFARAVEECKKLGLRPEDGEFKGGWLLTEINHWNMEQERIILLTSETLVIANFDFVTSIVRTIKKIPHKLITKLQIADLALPSFSVMPPRDHGAVRIHLGLPSFVQRWNPLSDSVPIITLTHHPAIYNKNETETVIYNVDDFAESLLGEAENAFKKAGQELVMDTSPILIESYVGLLSVVHNQSRLGYNMERGGIKY